MSRFINLRLTIEDYTTYPRDLSWLAFNHRVLQEAMDQNVPVMERLRFLGIYANNLEEFYRVRVAHHTMLARLKKKVKVKYDLEPERMIRLINSTVKSQQRSFDKILKNEIRPELAEAGYEFADENYAFTTRQMEYLDTYFLDEVKPLLKNAKVDLNSGEPFLLDDHLYHCVVLKGEGEHKELVLLRLPSKELPRFIVVPDKHKELVIFLDDVIRLCGQKVFKKQEVLEYWSIKITRDAELYLEDEFEGNIVQKIQKSLNKRSLGSPTRMLYDSNMPIPLLARLSKAVGVGKTFLVPGSKYHNLSDLQDVPFSPSANLVNKQWPPVRSKRLKKGSYFKRIMKEDVLLSFPYHSYDHILELISEAANDKEVEHLFITLYRVADTSKVSEELIKALKNGKSVTVFDEVKARFDEESNIYWGKKLEKAGAEVHYSFERIKVHSKVLYIRKNNGEGIGVISTGNFNEKTARFYADHTLITADSRLMKDLARFERFLVEQEKFPRFKELMVAPHDLRARLERLISLEIRNALRGRKAKIWLKLNSLEDVEMIERLYDASNAGVEIRLIIRGICCLIPGIPQQSENIKIISIVDRYLEHSRMYFFENGGDHLLYLSSADWMRRNLDGRVEVAVPVKNSSLRNELIEQFRIQWSDGVKARRINKGQTNPYRQLKDAALSSQEKLYKHIRTDS